MLKMRLQRIGRRNQADFRLVVTDSRRGPKSGKHIDLLGSYNPKLNQIQFDSEKIKEWIGKGVQVSDTVHNLLVSENIIEGKKRNVLPRKAPIVNEEAETAEEATPTEPATQSEETSDSEVGKEEDVSSEVSEGEAEESSKEAPAELTTPDADAPAEEDKDKTEGNMEEKKEELEVTEKAPAEEASTEDSEVTDVASEDVGSPEGESSNTEESVRAKEEEPKEK